MLAERPISATPSRYEYVPRPGSRRPGAVIIGGDYQGLGIVRSLGRRGVPTCVIDDERSIARFSRYATHAVACEDLRDERQTVASVVDVGERLGLDGWVLYATRDDTVAAFSRHRSELALRFRVPTPPGRRSAGHGTSARPTPSPVNLGSPCRGPGIPRI